MFTESALVLATEVAHASVPALLLKYGKSEWVALCIPLRYHEKA